MTVTTIDNKVLRAKSVNTRMINGEYVLEIFHVNGKSFFMSIGRVKAIET
jgi:hypothetical protein